MKKSFLAVATICAMASTTAVAADAFAWGNVYTDMLVNEYASQETSQILGIEGGVATDKTEVYGFFEVNPNLENEFLKTSIHHKVYNDIGVYGHLTKFSEGDFNEDRYVVGIGYQGFTGAGYAIKPYVGVVRIDQTFGTAENFAVGYAGYYAIEDGLTLSSWADARVDEDNEFRVSGNIGIQKDVYKDIYAGVFYNMNYGEQGVEGYSDSFQFRVGYHF